MTAPCPASPLLAALRDPSQVAGMSVPRLSVLLAQARATRLLSHVAHRCRDAGVTGLPDAAQVHLDSAVRTATEHTRHVDWELEQVGATLASLAGPAVLLKGAAYQALGMPHAAARQGNDLDVMVPRPELKEATRLLVSAGWRMADLEPHQVAFFRAWMHELPIFQHETRGTLLDLHHNILPAIDRICVPARALFAEAAAIPGCPAFSCLSPRDRVIHCALNIFRHGDFRHALRDLVDLDAMLRDFGDATFWYTLVERADTFRAATPLRLACRYAYRILGTPVPSEYQRLRVPGIALLDRLMLTAIAPPDPARANRTRNTLHRLLLHYPPCLWRKTIRPKLQRIGNAGTAR